MLYIILGLALLISYLKPSVELQVENWWPNPTSVDGPPANAAPSPSQAKKGDRVSTKEHGSSIRIVLGAALQSLYRLLCLSFVWPYYLCE